MLFLNLDVFGRYNDIILTYVCYNFPPLQGSYPYSSLNIFGMRKLIRVKFEYDVTLMVSSQKNLKTHVI